MRHVADAEGDRVGVEAAVCEGQRFGIALDAMRCARLGRLRRCGAADVEHLGADVADGPLPRPAIARVADRDVAGAAGDVEQLKRQASARRIEHRDQSRFHSRCRPPDIKSFIRS